VSRYELTFTIPGNPGDGSINAAYQPVKRGKGISLAKTKLGDKFSALVALIGRSAKARDKAAADQIRASPVVGARVTAYWPRKHGKLARVERLAFGDVDAVIKATLDPLQDWYGKGKRKKPGAGIYDDDARVVESTLRKRYDRDNPRIEVVIWGLEREP